MELFRLLAEYTESDWQQSLNAAKGYDPAIRQYLMTVQAAVDTAITNIMTNTFAELKLSADQVGNFKSWLQKEKLIFIFVNRPPLRQGFYKQWLELADYAEAERQSQSADETSDNEDNEDDQTSQQSDESAELNAGHLMALLQMNSANDPASEPDDCSENFVDSDEDYEEQILNMC